MAKDETPKTLTERMEAAIDELSNVQREIAQTLNADTSLSGAVQRAVRYVDEALVLVRKHENPEEAA